MKKQIEAITINRAEGPTELCGSITVTDWSQAELVVKMNASTAPNNGGYDKTDFTIKWEDGTEYDGVIEIDQDMASETAIIETHLINSLNSKINGKGYDALAALKGQAAADERAELAKDLKENYQIGAGA